MSNIKTFAPKHYAIRQPTDNNRFLGAIVNPPRFPEIGGMTKGNADKRDPELTLRKPGGTK